MNRWSSSKARWVAALACALATLYATSLRAGTTGKIAGQVTDRATGQPVPGAAVLLDGLRLGSTTDAEGRYFIIGVPPGTYAVKASLLGYAPITRTGVIVNIDRTTPADFQLASSAIEVEGLTVIAPREVIQLDVAGSRSTLEPEDVVALPNVTSLAGAISAEPGGAFRGGLVEETQLMLNGHVMTDERTARYNASSIPITSVQEVQILTSGFNAEYGNVRSGIINVVTRDDAQRIWINGRANYVPAQRKHWGGGAAYGPTTKEWQVYGSDASLTTPYKVDNVVTPVVGDSITVFPGWIKWIPVLPAARRTRADSLARADSLLQLWRHQHRITENDYANSADYVFDVSVGGPVPLISGLSLLYSHRNTRSLYALASARPAYTDFTEQLTLTYRLGRSAKISVTGKYTEDSGLGDVITGVSSDGTVGGNVIVGGWQKVALSKYAMYANAPTDNKFLLLGANFSHVLSTSTQYELGFDYQRNDYLVGQWPMRYLAPIAGKARVNPLWNDQRLSPGDTVGVWKIYTSADPYGVAPWGGDIGIMYEPLIKDQRSGLSYDFGSTIEHADSSWYTGIKLRGSLLSQITRHHQIKTGLELQQNNFHERRTMMIGNTPREYRVWFDKSPIRASAYVQDKMEYEGMVLNAGLRLDHFDPKSNQYMREDPFGIVPSGSIWKKETWNLTPTWLFYDAFDTSAAIKGYTIQKAFTHTKLAPRLAISHPLDQHSKVFFNYGHFYTYPTTQNLYSYDVNRSGTGIAPAPNPDLDLSRTIMYELAVEREFTNGWYSWLLGMRSEPQYLVRLAGYYKDVTSEISDVLYYYTLTDAGAQHRNNRYAQIRGFEMRISKRVGNFFTGWAQGQLSLRDSGAIGLYYDDPQNVNDQPQSAYVVRSLAEPSWSMFLDFHTPRRFSAFGMPAAATELWSASFVFSFSPGAWTTYNPALLTPPPPPNVRYKDSYGSSMRIAKGVSFGRATGEVYFDVANLLGYKSLWSGSMSGGEWNQYLASLHFPIKDVSIEKDYGNDRIGDTPSYALIADHDSWAHFISPRTYSVGVNFSF